MEQIVIESPMLKVDIEILIIWGRTVSTKKEDLVQICDALQIQVDNPLTILTQDTARQFLSNSTPQDKYQVWE